MRNRFVLWSKIGGATAIKVLLCTVYFKCKLFYTCYLLIIVCEVYCCDNIVGWKKNEFVVRNEKQLVAFHLSFARKSMFFLIGERLCVMCMQICTVHINKSSVLSPRFSFIRREM